MARMWSQLLKYSSIAIVFLPAILLPQTKVSSIDIDGNHHFSQRELLQGLPLAVEGQYSKEKLRASSASLVERYRSDGFFFSRIDSIHQFFSSDSTIVAVTFFLHEGKQSLLSDITVRGGRHFSPEDMLTRFETAVGSPLRQATLESDIDNLLSRYDNDGYPLASVRVDSLLLDSSDVSRMRCVLSVSEGPRVYVKEITVDGNTSTRSWVVAREAYVGSGELYSPDRVERFRRRLERLGIFSSVGEPELYVSRNPSGIDSVAGGLSVAVQEGNTNNFDGIVGYTPPAQAGQSGYFTGNVFVSMKNLFGTGRQAVVRWQRESPSTQELQASYEEPWIAGYPVDAGIGIDQRKQDSTYIKTSLNLRTDVNLSDEFSVALTANQESVVPSTDLDYFTVFESNTLSFGGEIHYDTRDDLRSPTSGISYATAYSRGTKTITGPAQYLSLAPSKSFLVEQLTVDVESYLPTFTRQVLMLGFHGKKITSSQLEQSDLFQLGGTNSVRGYRENQFYGSQVLWSNCQYRFLVGRFSSVFALFDVGYFSRPPDLLEDIPSQEKFIYGYGVGTRLETSLGSFAVSFALGEGDGFSSAKIHFGIANEF